MSYLGTSHRNPVAFNRRVFRSPEPGRFVQLIYSDRMRSTADKDRIASVFQEVFPDQQLPPKKPRISITQSEINIGDTTLQRSDRSVFNDENLLLLRSQKSALRSLAVCANMNWLAILVGHSGSGKSSLVRVLAQLAGQKLDTMTVNSAMDTTEILGSFEQTDHNRHLDDLYRHVEGAVEKVLRALRWKRSKRALSHLGQGSSIKDLEHVHGSWERAKAKFRKCSSGVDSFLGKAKALLVYVDKFGPKLFEDHVQVEDKLKGLVSLVNRDQCLNAGGRFEWVDSLLVKCLREGRWLVIEQVNLCNPAVLDRLNGLLEPNGVLDMGERGVDQDGNVVTVKPHPNFRLFLTMDPKNGEISRAMRNRGVEIFLDKGTEDDLDLRSVLLGHGLGRANHRDALLRVHQEVAGNVFLDLPNISQLGNCAFLIGQLMLRGFKAEDVFLSSCNDVYLKSKFVKDEETKRTLKDAVDSAMDVYKVQDNSDEFFDSTVTCALNEVQENSRMAVLKQQGFLLSWMARSGVDRSLFPDFEPESMLRHAILHFYELSTGQDVGLRKSWLDNLLGKRADFLQESEVLAKEIADFSSSNPDNLALLLYFQALIANDDRVRANSLMEYSTFVKEGKFVPENVKDPLVRNFAALVCQAKVSLRSILKGGIAVDEDVYATVRKNLHYLKRLESLGSLGLERSRNEITNLNRISLVLSVHYRWLVKFFQGFVSANKDELSEGSKLEVNKFLAIVNEVNAQLPINDPMRKLAKAARKAIFNVPPHSEFAKIEVHSSLRKLGCRVGSKGRLVEMWREFYGGRDVDLEALRVMEKGDEGDEENVWPIYEYLLAVFASAVQKDVFEGRTDFSGYDLSLVEKSKEIFEFPPELTAVLEVATTGEKAAWALFCQLGRYMRNVGFFFVVLSLLYKF